MVKVSVHQENRNVINMYDYKNSLKIHDGKTDWPK